MKKGLQLLLNKLFKSELELLYGKDSKIEVTNLIYCTNNKNFSIQCKLYVTDLSLLEEANTDGVNYLITESWKYLDSRQTEFAVTTSIDLL